MGGLFGGGGGTAPKIDTRKFDQRKNVEARTAESRGNSLALQRQLMAQTTGAAPSLATAQLKAAQDRNLSQLMAAAQAQRGGNSALQQRQMMMQQGQAGRALAQDSATARLQEQAQAQQLLANTSQAQQGQDLAQVMQPGQLIAQGEKYRYDADKARVDAVKDQQANVLGNTLKTVGRGIAAFYTGGASEAALAAADAGKAQKMAEGGLVPGDEVVKGDSQANDVVPAQLSAGELVVPKSVVEQGEKAISGFAKAVLAQHKIRNNPNDASKAFAAARKKHESVKMSEGGIVDALKQKYTEAKASGLLGTYAGTQHDAQKQLAQQQQKRR